MTIKMSTERSFKLLLCIAVLCFGIQSVLSQQDFLLARICKIYEDLHKDDFNVSAERSFEVNPGSIPSCEDRGSSQYNSSNCLHFRLTKVFFALIQAGHFRPNLSDGAKRYFRLFAFKMTGDYDNILSQCEALSVTRLNINNPPEFNMWSQGMGLQEFRGSFLNPSDSKCRQLPRRLADYALADDDLLNRLNQLCSSTLTSSPDYCKYFTLNKFATTLSENIENVQNSQHPCDSLRIAFIYSSIFYEPAGYKGTIAINVDTIQSSLISTVGNLATKFQSHGCNSNEVKNYYQAYLFAIPTTTWMRERSTIQRIERSNILGLFAEVMDVMVATEVYFEEKQANEKLIDRGVDYQTFLELSEITGTLDQRFNALSSYFSSIQGFNSEKANHDLAYINGRIARFRGDLETLSQTVGENVGQILDEAFEKALAEALNKGAQLTLSVAEACNPFKAIFGGTSATDIAEATDEFMAATADLQRSQELRSALTTLKDNVIVVRDGYSENQQVLSRAHEIVTQHSSLDREQLKQARVDFMQLYADYDPQVTMPQIDRVESQFQTVIDEACEIIQDAHGIQDFATEFPDMIRDATTPISPNQCLTTKWDIGQMMSVLKEIYDFQNDLMETCSQFLLSEIAKERADVLVSSKNDGEVSGMFTNDGLVDTATCYYYTNRCTMVNRYCNILEYRNGGVKPGLCTVDKVDVPSIVSHIPRSMTQEHKTIDVPDNMESATLRTSIDIERLMSGKSVDFKIEDFEWLRTHSDVLDSDRNDIIFVKDIKVFVPYLSNVETNPVKSTVTANGVFSLFPGSSKYKFHEAFASTFTYSEGKSFLECENDLKANKYTICEEADKVLDAYCPKTTFANTGCNDEHRISLFPPIYSKWSVRLEGYDDTLRRQPLPIPTTARNVKIVFTVCKFTSQKGIKKKESSKSNKGKTQRHNLSKRSNGKCCQDTEYWNEANQQCRECPVGSQQLLNGYYCGRQSFGTKKGKQSKAKGEKVKSKGQRVKSKGGKSKSKDKTQD